MLLSSPLRILFSLLGATAPPTLLADTYVCPAKITPNETINEPVSGWTTFVTDDVHHFSNVTLFDGHPRERASLVPIDHPAKAGKSVAEWNFSREKKYSIWLSCDYYNTNARYIKELPATVTKCAVTYKLLNNKMPVSVLDIRCE